MSAKTLARISIYAGPTGGHLFPAQSFAECLRKKAPNVQLALVTSRRAKGLVRNMPDGIFERICYLPDFGLPHKILSFKTIKSMLLLPFLFGQAFLNLLFFKPQLCVGFGSFVSYPGMMTAHALKIPTLVHEQNIIPGKATHWLALNMDVLAVSFEGTRLPAGVKNIRTIGLPLRTFITNRPILAHKREKRLNILVVGGSQGAHGLNEIVVASFARLSHEEREKIAVTHITGEIDRDWVSGQYRAINLASEVHSFFRDMVELFQKTDLAVTRAGANTLFELAFYGIPAFVVPFPYAGGHQRFNAEAFAVTGALEFHNEEPDAVNWLTAKFRAVLGDENMLKPMANAMKNLAKPNATEDLVDLALSLMKTQ